MKKSALPFSLLATLAMGGIAIAGDGPSSMSSSKAVTMDETSTSSLFDKIWGLPVLYKNDENAFLQEFKLIGRYQLQYAHVDSDQGNYSDWENRRWRIGAEAKLLHAVKLHGEINIDDSFNPIYGSLEEAYIEIEPGGSTKIIVGKQKPKFSYEWATSSRNIVTFERSLLVNQLLPDKSSGATVAGESGKWSYELGIYSGDLDDEFGGFDAGIFSLATVGYDFSESTGLKTSDLRFSYLYNGDSANNATADYRHSLSSSVVVGSGAWKVATDLLYADGFTDDAYGLVILPTYDITEKLQIVGRYQYAHGDNDSLHAQSRYERQVPNITDGGHGEDYNAFYAGLNYYLYGHKLKLMTGVEYSDLNDSKGDGGDFSGWTVFSGVRLYF